MKFKSFLCLFLAFFLVFQLPGKGVGYVNSYVSNLPNPGDMLYVTGPYDPLQVHGLKLNLQNPLEFNFIVDLADSNISKSQIADESKKLVKYFLAAMTVPDQDFWVNLSPYESDRIIPAGLSQTDLGRDMLAQDYVLKQLSASLTYPEDEFGNDFWEEIYLRAYEELGQKDISTDMFHKIWIVPNVAEVYEYEDKVFVIESSLKVMMEEDYLSQGREGFNHLEGEFPKYQKETIQNILIPIIQKEVNQGKHFARLRQMYHSMILANWYKKKLKDSILSDFYFGKNQIEGIELKDLGVIQKIYSRYVEAFKTGTYDYIKEEYDPIHQKIFPRKYFSGGLNFNIDQAMITRNNQFNPAFGEIVLNKFKSRLPSLFFVNISLDFEVEGDLSMISKSLQQAIVTLFLIVMLSSSVNVYAQIEDSTEYNIHQILESEYEFSQNDFDGFENYIKDYAKTDKILKSFSKYEHTLKNVFDAQKFYAQIRDTVFSKKYHQLLNEFEIRFDRFSRFDIFMSVEKLRYLNNIPDQIQTVESFGIEFLQPADLLNVLQVLFYDRYFLPTIESLDFKNFLQKYEAEFHKRDVFFSELHQAYLLFVMIDQNPNFEDYLFSDDLNIVYDFLKEKYGNTDILFPEKVDVVQQLMMIAPGFDVDRMKHLVDRFEVKYGEVLFNQFLVMVLIDRNPEINGYGFLKDIAFDRKFLKKYIRDVIYSRPSSRASPNKIKSLKKAFGGRLWRLIKYNERPNIGSLSQMDLLYIFLFDQGLNDPETQKYISQIIYLDSIDPYTEHGGAFQILNQMVFRWITPSFGNFDYSLDFVNNNIQLWGVQIHGHGIWLEADGHASPSEADFRGREMDALMTPIRLSGEYMEVNFDLYWTVERKIFKGSIKPRSVDLGNRTLQIPNFLYDLKKYENIEKLSEFLKKMRENNFRQKELEFRTKIPKRKIENNIKDNAQITVLEKNIENNEVGGIDLSPIRINTKSNDSEINFGYLNQQFKLLKNLSFKGFSPNIISVRPVLSLSEILSDKHVKALF